MLAAALTSPAANAEAALAPGLAAAAAADAAAAAPAPGRMLLDARGCCDYEVAEWVGDAVLRLLSVAHVLFEEPTARDTRSSRPPPGERRLFTPPAVGRRATSSSPSRRSRS